jgi:UDP-N-acetylmuramyl pentapeptide phosphotransferase/UDP-N-acetylglucosamine-1-phosphate transferase
VATPRGGGVAVVAAATAGLVLSQSTLTSVIWRLFEPGWRFALPHLDQSMWSITVPLLLFAAIGLAEDVRGVAVPARLALQAGAGLVAGLLLVPCGLGTPASLLLVGLVGFWLTGYVNAFNFMDGVNGISAVHAGLAGAVYAVVGTAHHLPVVAVAGIVTAAAAVSFLPWNAGRARIFLGDVGSYGLGGLLGAVAAYSVLRGVPPEAAVAPLALYLADTGWTLARRLRRGEPWYRPHRTHVYQRLTDLGWSHQRVTLATVAVSAAVCSAGLAAAHADLLTRLALVAAALAMLAGYLAAPALLALRRYRPRHEERSIYA